MTYKIGTRVKKVRHKHLLGLTGIVVARPNDFPGRYPDSIPIKCDTSWTDLLGCTHPAGTIGDGRASQWEPIIPDGASGGSWDDCVWKPEKVDAGA